MLEYILCIVRIEVHTNSRYLHTISKKRPHKKSGKHHIKEWNTSIFPNRSFGNLILKPCIYLFVIMAQFPILLTFAMLMLML